MQDGIKKGTGDSRFLKSVADFKSRYPTYDAFVSALAAGTLPIDFNGYNNAGWEMLPTFLNKGNLVSDTTARNFGLDTKAATPENIFGFLSQYNLHWWRRYPVNGDMSKFAGTTSSCTVIRVPYNDVSEHNIYYYDTPIVNGRGEVIGLKDRHTLRYSQQNTNRPDYSALEPLKGKYIWGMDYQSGSAETEYEDRYKVNFIPPTAKFGYGTDYEYWRSTTSDAVYNLHYDITVSETPSYVSAADINAYPPYGVSSDGWSYTYLGTIYDLLPQIPKIEICGLQGTDDPNFGKVEENPYVISFSFAPDIIVALTYNYNNETWSDPSGHRTVLTRNVQMKFDSGGDNFNLNTNAQYVYSRISEDGKTLSWYGDLNKVEGPNNSKQTYYFLGIKWR